VTPALIGVLTGAAATLVGISVQLWFNARQRERDRFMQLRRDAYFEAADGLAAALLYLSQVARADQPLGTAPPPSMAWFFKLHMVATTNTLIAFAKAGNAITSASIDMAESRLRVAEVTDDIQLIKDTLGRIERFQEDVRSESRLVMREVPSELNVKRMDSFKQQMDVSWNQMAAEGQKLATLVDEHARRTRTLLERSLVAGSIAQRHVKAAFLAARSELEMTIDLDRLAAAVATLDSEMSAKIEELISLIKVDNDQHVQPAGQS